MGKTIILINVLVVCVMRHVNLTITIPEELRERMKRIRINWSEVARRAFEEEVKRFERLEAVKIMDGLRTKVVGWSGVDEVRRWRDSRSTPR